MLDLEPPGCVRRFWRGILDAHARTSASTVVVATNSGRWAFATLAMGDHPGEPFNTEFVRVRLVAGDTALVLYRNRVQEVVIPDLDARRPTPTPASRNDPTLAPDDRVPEHRAVRKSCPEHHPHVGGKCASLGVMSQEAGLPVPALGFAITTRAFAEAGQASGLMPSISELLAPPTSPTPPRRRGDSGPAAPDGRRRAGGCSVRQLLKLRRAVHTRRRAGRARRRALLCDVGGLARRVLRR